MSAQGDYLPKNAAEQAIFDALWISVAPQSGELSGHQAVDFFKKSGVDSGILKQIWSLSTPNSAMNVKQFYTALRYITMVQNGEIPISKERLRATADTNFGPPKISGAQLPSTQDSMYAITPAEHLKYFDLFKTYDTDGDGFLSGTESVAVFNKSGLDVLSLRAIWELADVDRDNQLSAKEFCVGFHLILCISKKKLSLPPVLPLSLKAFLLQAPVVPSPTSSTPATNATAAPNAVALAAAAFSAPAAAKVAALLPPAPPAAASATVTAGSTVNAAAHISSLPEPSHIKSSVNPSASGSVITEAEQSGVKATVSAFRDATERAVKAQDAAIDSAESTAASLKSFLQKLAQEKVSLVARVSAAENSVTESMAKMESMVKEMKALDGELLSLREKLDSARKTDINAQTQLGGLAAEKQRLLQQINETRAAVAQASRGLRATVDETSRANGEAVALGHQASFIDAEQAALAHSIAVGESELETLRAILSTLRQDKVAIDAESTQLASQRAAALATSATRYAELDHKQKELQLLRLKEKALAESKREVLAQLSSSSPTTSPPSAKPAPLQGQNALAPLLPTKPAKPVPGSIMTSDVIASAPGSNILIGSTSGSASAQSASRIDDVISPDTVDDFSSEDFDAGDAFAADESDSFSQLSTSALGGKDGFAAFNDSEPDFKPVSLSVSSSSAFDSAFSDSAFPPVSSSSSSSLAFDNSPSVAASNTIETSSGFDDSVFDQIPSSTSAFGDAFGQSKPSSESSRFENDPLFDLPSSSSGFDDAFSLPTTTTASAKVPSTSAGFDDSVFDSFDGLTSAFDSSTVAAAKQDSALPAAAVGFGAFADFDSKPLSTSTESPAAFDVKW